MKTCNKREEKQYLPTPISNVFDNNQRLQHRTWKLVFVPHPAIFSASTCKSNFEP